ncbi:MAG TPA: response regulator transcription factor [Chloroflexota bacterium]|nr:response regulator transcription factor [Chloroflexota bacterium]
MHHGGKAVIQVALGDREHVLVQALARLIDAEPDLKVTGIYTDGDSLLSALAEKPADVVLLDPIGLSPLGMELVRLIPSAAPNTHAVVLTANQQEQQLFAAVRAGARGYLPKSADIDEVLDAVRAVAYGEALISPELAVQLLDEFARLSFEQTGLTGRERDILNAIVRGDSNREIAHQLGLSEKTVKNYVSDILSKLNVRDRTEAAVYALQMGLVTEGDWRLSINRRTP